MILQKRHVLQLCAVFCALMLLMLLALPKLVELIVDKTMEARATQVVGRFKENPNIDALLANLHRVQKQTSLRMTLLDEEQEILFASHDKIPLPSEKQSSSHYTKTSLTVGDESYTLYSTMDQIFLKRLISGVSIGVVLFFLMAIFFIVLIAVTLLTKGQRELKWQTQSVNAYLQGRGSVPNWPASYGIAGRSVNRMAETIESQSKKILEAEAEKMALLESLDEGTIVVDSHLQVSHINAKAARMLRIFPSDIRGRNFATWASKSNCIIAERTADVLNECFQMKEPCASTICVGESVKIYYNMIATPINDNKGAILVLQDHSSDYKMLEMGKSFIANASHELRTPITIIKGFAEILQEIPEMSEAMLQDITGKITRSCDRMSALVKNLLVLADLDHASSAQMSELDLIGLVEQCCHKLLAIYPAAEIEIFQNVDAAQLPGDADLLELAISNLLENAVKYSPKPATITITVDEREKETHLLIQDRGIGIAKKDLEHIFDRFYTENKGRSRKMGGAGLGLSIVKSIIDRHEGNLLVDSEKGEGTTFTIELLKNHS